MSSSVRSIQVDVSPSEVAGRFDRMIKPTQQYSDLYRPMVKRVVGCPVRYEVTVLSPPLLLALLVLDVVIESTSQGTRVDVQARDALQNKYLAIVLGALALIISIGLIRSIGLPDGLLIAVFAVGFLGMPLAIWGLISRRYVHAKDRVEQALNWVEQVARNEVDM